MGPWILIRDLFENKIYLLPVRCRVFDIYKISLILRTSFIDGLCPKVKGHEGRGISRIDRLRLLLEHIVASTIG
jgi:hypothetical protein